MSHPRNLMSCAALSPVGDDEGAPAAASRWITFPDPEGLIAYLLLLLAVAFNLYHIYPEVANRVPNLNDGVLHLLAVGRLVVALALRQDPTDLWLGSIAMGYPLFHHYQHLPHLPPALLHLLSLGRLPLVDGFNWTRYLLLSLFPFSIYWSMRRFGFARLPAALAGLVAPLIATDGLYGLDFASYVWGGYGLYTQLWGMLLLPLALAQGYTVLREGRGYSWAVLLLAATLLSHLVFGYIAAVTLALFVVVGAVGRRANSALDEHRANRHPLGDKVAELRQQRPMNRASRIHPTLLPSPENSFPGGQPTATVWQRSRRLILLLALVALVTAYFWVPFLLDSPYMNRSVWEEPGKYDSYGHEWVLGALVRGELFDFGRFPSLTLLAGAGLALCLWRWREERYRVPVALFGLWLLLYFGRPTWGVLLDLLPLSRDLHLHRLIAGVHLAGIILMGIGLAFPWQWALSRRDARYLLAPAVLTALLLVPVYQERAAYLGQNGRWMVESQAALDIEAQDIEALTDTLWELPPGRVYAGLAATWGKDYRVGAVPVYALLQRDGFDMLGHLYHALSLNADVQVLFDETRPEHYDLFNVRYVVAPIERTFPDFVRPVQDFGRHRLYQVATTGYFDLVGSDLVFAGDKSDFYPAASRWLGGDLLWAKQHPALFLGGARPADRQVIPLSQAGEVMAKTSFPAEPARGRVVSERIKSNVYQAQIEVERESTLLLKVTYHPNWQATVDGVAAETMMIMPSYVGVKVASGVHHVRLEYRPRPLRRTLLIVGLLALPLIALAEWRREELARLIGRLNLTRLKTRLTVGFRMKLGIYLLFLSVYLMSGAGHFFSTDHVSVYLTTQSLVENHTLAIKPIHDTVIGPDGQAYSVFGLGQSLASIPLYLIGRAVDSISPPPLKEYWSGVDLGDWGGTVPIFFVSLFNQFVTPLTCVLVFLFCLELGFPQRTSLFTTLVFGFSTAAWVYARDYFQHPLESLLVLLSIYILFRHRGDLQPGHALLSGISFAFGVLTRINVILIAPPILIYLLFIASKRTWSDTGPRHTLTNSCSAPFLKTRA